MRPTNLCKDRLIKMLFFTYVISLTFFCKKSNIIDISSKNHKITSINNGPLETSLYLIKEDKETILDIRWTGTDIRIYNTKPGYELSNSNAQYRILDQFGKEYKFTSASIFDTCTSTGLNGGIQILKNDELIFEVKYDCKNFYKCNFNTPREKLEYKSTNITTSGVGYRISYWPIGNEITVKFLKRGPQWFENEIKQGAKEWEKHINLKFKFVEETAEADIRIAIYSNYSSFENGVAGGESYVGTLPYRDKNEATMSFYKVDNSTSQKTRFSIILHEWGHALGLKHEQEHINSVENKCKLIFYYTQKGYTLLKAIAEAENFFYKKAPPTYEYSEEYDPNPLCIILWEF